MTLNGWIRILFFLALLTALTWPLGGYLRRVFERDRPPDGRGLGALEHACYRLAGVDPRSEQKWTAYTLAMLTFNLVGFVAVYTILLLQDRLPWNPRHLPALSAHLAFNTAVSFVTNTSWQSYGGETTLSYLSQMVALTVQYFVSSATGIVLAVALVRGFARRSGTTLGNFWVDLTRCTLYVLLPLAAMLALLLVWQGVPQNLHDYVKAGTIEGAAQTIAQGPVASQIAIKQLGSDGGGFFNANSAHPYENPTALSNLLEMLAMLLIPAALTNTLGRMVRNPLQGWALYSAMALLFLASASLCYWAESQGNPAFSALGIDQTPGALQAGGNMEGKEARYGTADSVLWATVTTASSNGSVNAMHDSFTPLGGFAPMLNIMLGEVIFGGVGSGLYGMLLYALLAVFIGGLMVGRTPEYLGKKIEVREMKMTMLAFLCLPLGSLPMLALACVTPAALASLGNGGPHGFSEMLYAYDSATGTNGSAFAGLNANVPYWDITLGIAMLIGRYAFIVPMMAVAGSLVTKKAGTASAGTLPTTGPLFIGLLIAIILIVSGLTYFPALALGPVAEHFSMLTGSRY
ncbi:MAG: potassium-transporting ATPase subunit KdpA [Nevskia sp.]|nr:potassium-transporting ATPase subunit KdpA [Nevskia sp.]